jgi:hypothetical protein
VTGESGGNPEVTERDPGQSHANTKTTGGAANLYSSASTGNPQLSQAVTTSGAWYLCQANVTRQVAGSARLYPGDYFASSAALHQWTARSVSGTALLKTDSPTDVTLSDMSVRLLSTLEQLFRHAQPYGDFSVTLSITGNYQAGVVFNGQDANNGVWLYYDRRPGYVVLIKRSVGTTTVIGSWAATYGAGKTLTARRHRDGTLDVIYDGVMLASGLAATGLAGVQAGPFLTDASGVTISRYTWDARRVS